MSTCSLILRISWCQHSTVHIMLLLTIYCHFIIMVACSEVGGSGGIPRQNPIEPNSSKALLARRCCQSHKGQCCWSSSPRLIPPPRSCWPPRSKVYMWCIHLYHLWMMMMMMMMMMMYKRG
ncbi:hypothetical protein SEVIR_7G310901v4 [Setaria viridis]